MKSIFLKSTTDSCLARLEQINPDTKPAWGTMTAPQMLAHLNVAYDMAYGVVDPKFNAVTKLLLKWFAKPSVVGTKPYKKNTRTAPIFKIERERDFDTEKAKLQGYIHKTEQLGAAHFEGRDYVSFGKMTSSEWSTLFYKHMDHHFTQFGV